MAGDEEWSKFTRGNYAQPLGDRPLTRGGSGSGSGSGTK